MNMERRRTTRLDNKQEHSFKRYSNELFSLCQSVGYLSILVRSIYVNSSNKFIAFRPSIGE